MTDGLPDRPGDASGSPRRVRADAFARSTISTRALGLHVAGAAPALVFFASALAVVLAAGLMSDATEQLSARSEAGVAGPLSVMFGDAAELIIAFFALLDGLQEVVKASLIGSVLGNSPLVLGAAMVAGGRNRTRQRFDPVQRRHTQDSCSSPLSFNAKESYDADMSETSTRGMIGFLEIDRDECMRMLAAASVGVGRVAFSMPGSRVSIRPVNYAFDEPTQSVVFRSALGSRLLAALSSGPAVFEIDGGDPVERTGWSVIIAGHGEEVTDPADIERLEGFELDPWAPGLKAHWVRIRATSVSGRRIVRVSDAMLGESAPERE
jgi:hypothetical protein